MIPSISNKITYTNIALLLLILNIVAGFIWIFGFHNIRLISLAFSGTALLFLFFISKTTDENIVLKLLLGFYIIFGFVLNFSVDKYASFLVDISTFGILTSVFLLDKLKYKQLRNGILFIVLLSIVIITYTIPFTNLSLIGGDADRAEAFISLGSDITQGGGSLYFIIYYTQQMGISFLLFFLLLVPIINNSVKKKYLVILIGISILYILVYSAYFQKRQSLIELTLILIFSFFLNKHLLKGLVPQNKFVNIIFVLIVLFAIMNLNILSNVFNRISNTLNDLDSFDRIEESKQVLSSFNFFEWVFGKGFGYLAPDTPGGIILHIGYSNLIMKGGIILLVIYFFQTITNIIYCKKRAQIFPEYYIGISISLFSMIQLFYAPGYHWFATTLITGLAMFSRYPLNSIIYDKYSNARTQRRKIYRKKHSINS